MQVSIRELAEGEVDLLRKLRLRALQDAPGEFGDRFEDADARPMDFWEGMAANLTGASRQRMFIAHCDGVAVGSVFALGDPEDPKAARLGGMWVESNARRRGVGRALADTAIGWARERHLERLNLWVADGDTPAHRLYLRAGFSDTSVRDTSRARIDSDLVSMTFRLQSSDR